MITQSRLHELLSYDPETGVFAWKKRTGRCSAGAIAGCQDDRGYVVLSIDGKRYYAHRLAWLYSTGQFPSKSIDHINGEKFDNRIKNLRDVNTQTNLQNLKKAMVTNKSTGILGVRKLRGKFLAQITIEGKETHLGTFNSAEDAYAVYLQAKRRFHNGCTI
jgi:hypothetical protein